MSKWLNLNGILAILARYGFCEGSPEFSSLIEEMRIWVADCVWHEDAEELSELSDTNILLGVNRNYCGGIEAFLTDAGRHPQYVLVKCETCGKAWDSISPCAPCNATSALAF